MNCYLKMNHLIIKIKVETKIKADIDLDSVFDAEKRTASAFTQYMLLISSSVLLLLHTTHK